MTNNEITVNDYSSTRLSRARLTLKVDGPYFPMVKFQNPYEQTLMSHCYQETVKGNIKSGIFLPKTLLPK